MENDLMIVIYKATDTTNASINAVLRTDTIRLTVNREGGTYTWSLPQGAEIISNDPNGSEIIVHLARVVPGEYTIAVTHVSQERTEEASKSLHVLPVPGANEVTPVSLRRTSSPFTPDVALWMLIQRSTRALSFNNFQQSLDTLLLGEEYGANTIVQRSAHASQYQDQVNSLQRRRFLPFNDTDAYRFLKVFTEAFILANVNVAFLNGEGMVRERFSEEEITDAANRISTSRENISPDALADYLEATFVTSGGEASVETLPYLALVRQKLREYGIERMVSFGKGRGETGLPPGAIGILEERLTAPIMLELIWSYWQEEGMLVQTMNTIARRFQNIRGPHERDPLSNFEIDPLRPLNNLLWGYVQDEQHRLSVVRRAYEYDHHYGISLVGKAIPQLRSADSRSRFIEAFHNLLYLCTQFYEQDDDTTVVADGFPILNALREVHLELSKSAHNQFGDLPSTARQEMLMQQWLLARPEFREFLPTRIMVAYPEPWMDRVDAMKNIQGWSDTSVLQYHYLATYGEELLLSIRYGAWNHADVQREWAANWARFWRNAVTNYIHSYRAVTGVDLRADLTSTTRTDERYQQPSLHLSRRLATRRSDRALPPPSNGSVGSNRALPAPQNGTSAGGKNRPLPASRNRRKS